MLCVPVLVLLLLCVHAMRVDMVTEPRVPEYRLVSRPPVPSVKKKQLIVCPAEKELLELVVAVEFVTAADVLHPAVIPTPKTMYLALTYCGRNNRFMYSEFCARDVHANAL